MNYLCVIFGGGIGSLLRYISSHLINTLSGLIFPVGTLFVNMIGSLCIGFLFYIVKTRTMNTELQLLLMTGFLGGYTTFSTYTLETVQFVLNNEFRKAIFNILINNILCLLFVLFGIKFGKLLIK
ncbi:MAG: fluoride efflux transporter CrcB [Treponema sp.]|jgi:CrcB protein|nr:fluoride efflux transporter CrcB [Treponema sp.]